MADYTANPEGGNGGNDPTVNKEELIKHVLEAIATAIAFLKEHDIPKNVKIIGDKTFSGCSKLATMNLKNNELRRLITNEGY